MLAVSRCAVTAAVALCAVGGPARAENYWRYSFQNVEIVTVGGADRATTLAEDVVRFDNALTQILQLSAAPLPTRIHELPGKVNDALLGVADAAVYSYTPYGVTVVSGERGTDEATRNWGLLFGYTGGLLASGRDSRCPYWFQIGVPLLFANAEFDSDRIKTGGNDRGFAYLINTSNLIPMRVLLRTEQSDSQLANSATYRSLFQAESWYLAREVFVESMLREEFGHYLGLIRQGQSEPDAFAGSFKVSYEDLDRKLAESITEPTHIYVVKVPKVALGEAEPRRLAPAEVAARLAELNMMQSHAADTRRLADESLREDPASELALRVRARLEERQGDFGAALADLDRLGTLPAPSAAGSTDRAELLASIAEKVGHDRATVGADAGTLYARARDAFEGAIRADPEFLRAWAGLADLYTRTGDEAGAKALVVRAQPVLERHRGNDGLARALALMCARSGQSAAALRFAQAWRDAAITPQEFTRAVELVARLQSHEGVSHAAGT